MRGLLYNPKPEATMDNLIAMLRNEERKLAGRLSGLRAAIHALSGNGSKPQAGRGHKLRGRKLSAAHRAAIKAGIAKAKKAAAKT
jgi:hypothetical protein